MDRTTTGKEYAAALFSLAKEAGAEQVYYDALCAVKEQFDANAEYPYLLDSPDIPAQKRQELLAQAFSDALPQDVLAFAAAQRAAPHGAFSGMHCGICRDASAGKCRAAGKNFFRPAPDRCAEERGRGGAGTALRAQGATRICGGCGAAGRRAR